MVRNASGKSSAMSPGPASPPASPCSQAAALAASKAGMYYNMFAHGVLFGWALVSYQYLTNKVIAGLVAVAGPVAPTALPAAIKHTIIVVALFIGYELGYWLQHWLCHRVPFFWQFHRVHHSAAVLTPFTNFRVHPVDTILFANVLAVTVAVANGLTNYALGDTSHQHTVSGTNVILIVFIHLYVHLQHTELWIPLRGVLGRIFMRSTGRAKNTSTGRVLTSILPEPGLIQTRATAFLRLPVA